MSKTVVAVVTGVVVALVVGGAAFWGGMTYQAGRDARRGGPDGLRGGFGGRMMGNGAPGGNGARGGFASGSVISKDDKSITVKLPEGGSKVVYLSSSARITRSAEATATDLKVGDNVVVGGTPGSDGGITARTIQIVPEGMLRPRTP